MDFVSAGDAGVRGLPDPEVLAVAAAQNRILVTHDIRTMPQHFARFLMQTGFCPGVFLVSQNEPIGEVVDDLVLVWAASDQAEWVNRILRIPQR